jgi:hypothetical protein
MKFIQYFLIPFAFAIVKRAEDEIPEPTENAGAEANDNDIATYSETLTEDSEFSTLDSSETITSTTTTSTFTRVPTTTTKYVKPTATQSSSAFASDVSGSLVALFALFL